MIKKTLHNKNQKFKKMLEKPRNRPLRGAPRPARRVGSWGPPSRWVRRVLAGLRRPRVYYKMVLKNFPNLLLFPVRLRSKRLLMDYKV